jgi:hypothetical protein
MATDASLNVCTNIAYLNSIDQKRRFQLFNIPPIRYNNLAKETNVYLQTNPKTGDYYKKYDLDMRRKAEVLKYSSNRMSTQTNNLTKAQKYAKVVKGSYQQRTYSREFIENNTVNGVLNICPPGFIIKTSTTASDVPGTPILLYDDESIPLYNFINDTNTPYAIINQELNPYSMGFNYSNSNNVLKKDTDPDPKTIFTLYFFNVNSPYYNFTFYTPISIGFKGDYLSGVTTPYSSGDSFQLTINSISLTVLYSYSSVIFSSQPVSHFLNNTVLNIDISNNNVSSFNGSCFFDIITFSNIILPAKLGYIYDFQLNIIYNITQNDVYIQNYNTPVLTTYFNATSPNIPNTYNCRIQGNPTVSFPPLTIIGAPTG